jgi:hypothetical protein
MPCDRPQYLAYLRKQEDERAVGPDCDLRRHGQAIAARGGKNAKKRAVVAVARKLAVLLHRLWRTRAVFEPLRNASLTVKAA